MLLNTSSYTTIDYSSYDEVPWEELARYPQVVFKDGYGMQRMVQEQFERRGIALKAALELNTPDAFRGVVRQGELLALLPETALVDAYADPTLAIRTLAASTVQGSSPNAAIAPPLTRQVVLVIRQDRLQIPPMRHFYQLVARLLPQQVNSLPQPAVEMESINP